MPLILKLRFFPFGSFGPRDIRIKQRSSLAAGLLFPSFLVFFPGIIPCQRDGSFRLNFIFHIDSMSSKISKKVKTLQFPCDPSKAKIFGLLFGREPSKSDLIIALFLDHFPSHLECTISDSEPCKGETVAPVH